MSLGIDQLHEMLQTSELKTQLLQIICYLIDDAQYTKEKAAQDLIQLLKTFDQL